MSESIFRALKNLAARESQPEKALGEELKSIPTLLYFLSITLIFLSLLILFIGKVYEYEALGLIALIFLLIGYLGLLLQPIVLLFYYRKSFRAFFRNPIGILINNAKRVYTIDQKYLEYFLSRKIKDLEIVLIELNSEKESFEKRISLIVGAIDKIGLLPGVIAVIVSMSKIKAIELDWVIAIAYATPILYLFGVYAHFLISRMNRHAELIKYSINKSPNKANQHGSK